MSTVRNLYLKTAAVIIAILVLVIVLVIIFMYVPANARSVVLLAMGALIGLLFRAGVESAMRDQGEIRDEKAREIVRACAVAATSVRGKVDIFVVNTDGKLLRWRSSEGWKEPLPPLGARAFDVASISDADGQVICFASDKSGRLWCWESKDGGRRVWEEFGGSPRPVKIVAVDAVSGWPGHQEVFAVTADGGLHHCWKSGNESWSTWEYMRRASEVKCRNVALSAPTNGIIECFIVDQDGRVWHRWFNRASHKWSELVHLTTQTTFLHKRISVVNDKDGHQELFSVSTGGELYHREHWQGSDWSYSDWNSLSNRTKAVDVAASSSSGGSMECILCESNGQLWRIPNPGWLDRQQIKGRYRSTP